DSSLSSPCRHATPDLHPFPTRRSSDLVLGGGGPVGVDGLDVPRVGLTAPHDHELLDDGLALVDQPLRDHRLAEAARRLGDEGERSEEHTSELQSRENLVCRLLLEKKNT